MGEKLRQNKEKIKNFVKENVELEKVKKAEIQKIKEQDLSMINKAIERENYIKECEEIRKQNYKNEVKSLLKAAEARKELMADDERKIDEQIEIENNKQ